MKIGIDARLYGPKHTGIGRYTENLIKNIFPQDQENQYFIFGDPTLLLPLAQHPNVNIIGLKTRTYSLSEQIINTFIFSKYKLDLLHVPHFNAPLLYPGKLVITIHDLIKHLSTGPETTTLPMWQYYFKHFVYKIHINLILKKAIKIITPSHYWKNYLVNHLSIPGDKITVTYEAVASKLKPVTKINSQIVHKYQLEKPFLIYTGNLYPHKNVDLLINAVQKFNQKFTKKITLAIISGRSAFQSKIKPCKNIKFLGFVPDEDFAQLYSQSLALVQPSLIEGFGLTGLEAMSLRLPVISSTASCLPEIYGDAALFFDPFSIDDLIEKIDWLTKDKDFRNKLIKKGIERSSSFSWKQTAKQTLYVYEQAVQK